MHSSLELRENIIAQFLFRSQIWLNTKMSLFLKNKIEIDKGKQEARSLYYQVYWRDLGKVDMCIL